MIVSHETIKKLNLEATAETMSGTALRQMPQLISERSVGNAPQALAACAKERLRSGHVVETEVISMPKKNYGLRPITLTSPEGRLLYEAAVGAISEALPEDSRATDYERFLMFGAEDDEPSSSMISTLDIAACYESISHEILLDELAIQAADADVLRVIGDLLSEVSKRGVGIPQAMRCSDALADAYLERLARGIAREGYRVARFADDIKIVSANWGEAHAAIERTAELARSIGLALADGKTSIRSADQTREEEGKYQRALEEYRAKAEDRLASIDFVQVDYDDIDIVEVPAPSDEVDFAMLSSLVSDWADPDHSNQRVLGRLGPRSLRRLQDAPERVSDDVLVKKVRREPMQLVSVLGYLIARNDIEPEENWQTLKLICEIPRSSPWWRLWILHAASEVDEVSTDACRFVLEWARQCLEDRYESVRAEACWLLAIRGQVSIKEIARQYSWASTVSRPGIAAAAGRVETGDAPLHNAIRNDSALSKIAFEWSLSEST